MGCTENPPTDDPGETPIEEPIEDPKEDPKEDPVKEEHHWSTKWTTNQHSHYRTCTDKGCEEISDPGAHTFGEWTTADVSKLSGSDKYNYTNPEIRSCTVCGYYEIRSGQAIASTSLPELRFSSPQGHSFATTAKKDDLERPEITGTFTLSNCEDKYKMTDVPGTMKVRGNQTAGWQKKGFRIKFSSARNILGLNEGQSYKKWVLFADAKDTALIRTALGLYISNQVCPEEGIWCSDFTPVSVYLDDEYWGYYYLAEQKETKSGRIDLPVPAEEYSGTDIGYCFELDYYATNEAKKTDGDPTFTISYKPNTVSYSLQQSEGIANFWSHIGVVKTYTMLSDITDKTTQIPWIKKRVENLYTILYQAAVNNKAYMIDSSDNVVVSTESNIEKNLRNYFNLETWADGYIINEVAATPDVGYSSFYMSFDNTANGEKKLRFENPWDFDSNFGNRSGFITNGEDLWLKRSANMWLNCLSKLSFFMDIVKTKWNSLRQKQAFENTFKMARTYFKNYGSEMERNLQRWPTNDAASELRDPFKNTKDYLKARTETINWLSKRVNYLEKQWGTGRANVNTYPEIA